MNIRKRLRWVEEARRAVGAARKGDPSGIVYVHYLICQGMTYDELGTSEEELDRFLHHKAVLESRQALRDCRSKLPQPLRALDIELNMGTYNVTLEELGVEEVELRGHLLREASEVLARVRRGVNLTEFTADLDVYLAADRYCSHITPESLEMTPKDAALVRSGALQRAMRYAEQLRWGNDDARFALVHEIQTYGLTQQELGFTDDEMQILRPSYRPPAPVASD